MLFQSGMVVCYGSNQQITKGAPQRQTGAAETKKDGVKTSSQFRNGASGSDTCRRGQSDKPKGSVLPVSHVRLPNRFCREWSGRNRGCSTDTL